MWADLKALAPFCFWSALTPLGTDEPGPETSKGVEEDEEEDVEEGEEAFDDVWSCW